MEQKIILVNIGIDKSDDTTRKRTEYSRISYEDVTYGLSSYINEGWIIKQILSNNILSFDSGAPLSDFPENDGCCGVSLTVLLEKE